MRKPLLIVGAIAVVAVAAALIWRMTDRPSDAPVRAVPERDYPVADVAFFQQNDRRWAGDALGASRYKMAGSGCLVSCIASSLAAQGIDTDPGRLNQAFTEHGVYNDKGEIVWDNISKAFPGVRVTMPAQAGAADLEEAVKKGLLPIVKVKYSGIGYQHWVLLIGADENGYLCMDPLNPEKEPLPLAEHGGVIYRYRIVTVDDRHIP
jgi:hypothetical protein